MTLVFHLVRPLLLLSGARAAARAIARASDRLHDRAGGNGKGRTHGGGDDDGKAAAASATALQHLTIELRRRRLELKNVAQASAWRPQDEVCLWPQR